MSARAALCTARRTAAHARARTHAHARTHCAAHAHTTHARTHARLPPQQFIIDARASHAQSLHIFTAHRSSASYGINHCFYHCIFFCTDLRINVGTTAYHEYHTTHHHHTTCACASDRIYAHASFAHTCTARGFTHTCICAHARILFCTSGHRVGSRTHILRISINVTTSSHCQHFSPQQRNITTRTRAHAHLRVSCLRIVWHLWIVSSDLTRRVAHAPLRCILFFFLIL